MHSVGNMIRHNNIEPSGCNPFLKGGVGEGLTHDNVLAMQKKNRLCVHSILTIMHSVGNMIKA